MSLNLCAWKAAYRDQCITETVLCRISERRALAWMAAVCKLFWDQCKMALFMYGFFEDTKGELCRAVYVFCNSSLVYGAYQVVSQLRYLSAHAQRRSDNSLLP